VNYFILCRKLFFECLVFHANKIKLSKVCFNSRFSSSQAANAPSAVMRCRKCSRASLLGSIMA
jgi:hypothetical protein